MQQFSRSLASKRGVKAQRGAPSSRYTAIAALLVFVAFVYTVILPLSDPVGSEASVSPAVVTLPQSIGSPDHQQPIAAKLGKEDSDARPLNHKPASTNPTSGGEVHRDYALMMADHGSNMACVCINSHRFASLHLRLETDPKLNHRLNPDGSSPTKPPEESHPGLPWPLRSRATFSPVVAFLLPSWDRFDVKDLLSHADNDVVVVGYRIDSCIREYSSNGNGTFSSCFKVIRDGVVGSSGLDGISLSTKLHKALRGVVDGIVPQCPADMPEHVTVPDLRDKSALGLEKSPDDIGGDVAELATAAAMRAGLPECRCRLQKELPKKGSSSKGLFGVPADADDSERGSQEGFDADTPIVPNGAGVWVAMDVAAQMPSIISAEKKRRERLRAEAQSSVKPRPLYNKTAFLCDPHDTLSLMPQCSVAPSASSIDKIASDTRDSSPALMGAMRVFTLSSAPAVIACYRGDDIVCNAVAGSGTWEVELHAMMLTSLRMMRDTVKAARDTLSRFSFAYQKSRRAQGHEAIAPLPVKESELDDGVTFLDVGANVGAFSTSLWAMGHPVISIDALPSNIRLLKTTKCINVARTKEKHTGTGSPRLPQWDIHHAALGPSDAEPHACGLYSDDTNVGDAMLLCDPEVANKEVYKKTYRRRALLQQTSIDRILGLGPSSSKEDQASRIAAVHNSSVSRLMPHLLDPVLAEVDREGQPANDAPKAAMSTVVVPVRYEDLPTEIRVALKSAPNRPYRHPNLKRINEHSSVGMPTPLGLDMGDIGPSLFGDLNVPIQHENVPQTHVRTIAELQALVKHRQFIMKIDVEAHELEVMRGGGKFFDRFAKTHARPKLILSEVWHTLNLTAYVELMVEKHGYRAYSLLRKAWIVDAPAAADHMRYMNDTKTNLDSLVFVEPYHAELMAAAGAQLRYLSGPMHKAAVEKVVRVARVAMGQQKERREKEFKENPLV